MSKKRKPGHSSSAAAMFRSMFGGGAPRREDVDDVLAMLGQSFSTGLAVQPSSPPRQPSRSSIWRKYFYNLVEKNSKNFSHHSFYGKFSIDKVYADGMVTGHVLDSSGVKKANLFAFGQMPSDDQTPTGCSCARSQGKYVCEHTLPFFNYLLKELEDPASKLSQAINRGHFEKQAADFKIFRYDPSIETLNRLADLLTHSTPSTSEDDSRLVPAVERETMQRMAWHFEARGSYIDFFPMVQSLSKKGDRWLRGKRLSWTEAVLSDADRTESDNRLLQNLSGSSDRSGGIDLAADEAALYLVGQPNVFLSNQPVTIEEFDGMVEIVRQDDGNVQLAMKRATGLKGTKAYQLFGKSALLLFSPERSMLLVHRATGDQLRILSSLSRLPSVGAEHFDALVKHAAALQSMINVVLPEEVAGPLVKTESKAVLLLRSRKDGRLDYGLRVRDGEGVLRKLGRGVLIKTGKRDGQPVQWQRDFDDEQDTFRKLQAWLELPEGFDEGTLSDMDQIFGIFEKLQSSPHDTEVLWDESSEKPIRVLGTVTAQNVRVGIAQKRDWFSLQGECQVGDESIEISSLLEGLRATASDSIQGNYVRVGDQGWVRISDRLKANLRKLDDSVNHERGMIRFDQTAAHAMRDLQQQLSIDTTKAWTQCMERLERAEKLEPQLPTGLQASLRDYQLEGYQWLRRLAEWGVGGVLADDMGLGKTLQTLAVLLDRANEGPSLVIAPMSVGFNWIREVEKFAPQLQAVLYRETDRGDFLEKLGPNQLVVCSYGLALRDAERLAQVDWANMILDEAQAVKNSRSKTAAAIASIPSRWTVALTGTPVENHLGELWSIFRLVAPGVFGGWENFRSRFAVPIERNEDAERRESLKNRLKPFVLRRTKKEVLRDLPARTEMNLYVELSPAERALYEQVRKSAMGEIDAIAKLPDIQDQRFRILALLTRLRQISCHPRIVHETWKDRSAKLNQLHETLSQLKEEGHRTLIFSQFVQHLSLIREMLDQENISYQYLDGSTSAEERIRQVDAFQNGDATAFLISLKAGGTGLNLTAADYVIHMDPWWNPAVEDQATDRAHRIGQTKPVMVYRIVAQNTIEEEILKLHDTKRDLVAGILEGSQAAAKLSTEDLIALIRK
jgi:superfamily II DNA or RNA helicase